MDGHSFEPSSNFKLLDLVTPHAFAAGTLGYTDNLFRERSPGVHTPTSAATLGARADVQMDDHVFSAGYRATEAYNFNAPRPDYFTQLGDVRLDLNYSSAAIHADASYGRTLFPAAIQIAGLAIEQVYAGQGWLELRWNRVGVKAGVSGRRDDFESTGAAAFLGSADHKTAGVGAQAWVEVQTRIRLLLEYDFEAVRFDRRISRDYDAHQLRGGVNGELSAKLAFSAKVGYTEQVLGQATTAFSDHGGYRGFNAAVALSWRALETLTVSAAYRRDLTWALLANYETVDYVNLGATYRFGPSEKLAASAGFTYSHGEPSTGDHYDRIDATLSLGYKIMSWMDVNGFYRYSQGFGSGRLRGSEYDEHAIGVSLAVGI